MFQDLHSFFVCLIFKTLCFLFVKNDIKYNGKQWYFKPLHKGGPMKQFDSRAVVETWKFQTMETSILGSYGGYQ